MVANIRSGATPGGALYYNKEKLDKGEAELLYFQKMLHPLDALGCLNIDACMKSFRPYLLANKRTRETVFHASLNPSPEDRLSNDRLREIVREYMERMGYGEQPYIVFKHKDIDREHLHIVSLRIDAEGKKIKDSHERDRSMNHLRSLEEKYGLHPAVKGQEQAEREGLRKVHYPAGNVKQQVSSVVRSCLRRYKCSSYGELRTLLEAFNVFIEERTGTIDGRDYAGIVYGALTDDGSGIGTPFKSSKIGRDVGFTALQSYYERSKSGIKEEGVLDHAREAVRLALKTCDTRENFRQMLRQDGIDAVFRINALDRIYGVTFIDHEAGIVANGSVLGKVFSANTLNDRFPSRPEQSPCERKREPHQAPTTEGGSIAFVPRIVTEVVNLFDLPAYEEPLQKQRRKKKHKRHRL